MTCECKYCTEMHRFFAIVGTLQSEEDKKWMHDLYEKVDNERLDANVNQAILDGSWPSAMEQLERALERARIKREDSILRS